MGEQLKINLLAANFSWKKLAALIRDKLTNMQTAPQSLFLLLGLNTNARDAVFSLSLTLVVTISLSLNEGEMVSIIGPNGAGKSTLLKIINGDYKSDTGTIVIDGEELSFSNPKVRESS